jgi:Domain of unknown function (DUF222)
LSEAACSVERMFDLVAIAAVDPCADEAALVEQIAELERVKSAAAAGQARASALLDDKRRSGVVAGKRSRGVAGEIGLARHDSPAQGARHLRVATTLVADMPHTLAALECGALSEWRATLITQEAADLSPEDRQSLDAELCSDVTTLEGMGNKRIRAQAKAIAHRLDEGAAARRAAKAAAERRVSIRPAPNAMCYLSVLLPAAQGTAVYATLDDAADAAAGDGRARGAVMTDTVVQRVTGHPAAQPAPVAVNLVLSDTTLFGADNCPALLEGYGPIPAAVARRLVSDAVLDERTRATLRRLYRHPESGALVAMESRSRRFPKGLARFIGLRDQTCRTPYCDAPIRHRDHAQPRHRGGPTSALNGLGMCERCNYTKETPGWRVSTCDTKGVHTAEFVTPTGKHYRSTAPPLPGPPPTTVSGVEVWEVKARIGIDLPDLHAA